MLLLELAQARLGQADAHGEGSGGRRNKGGEVAGRGVLQDSKAALARLGQILLGWEVSLCLMSHLRGYDLLK